MDKGTARTIRLLSWFNFLQDFRLYAPVAILYYTRISGSFASGMSVFAAAQLSSAVLELPTGVLSDWIGRKKTLVLGAACSTLSVACYAAAPGLAVLWIGAALEGAASALFSGNNNALLFDCLREGGMQDRFHEFLGRLGAWFQMALAASALLGGILADRSFRLVMALSVLPQAAALVLSLLVREPRAASGRREGDPVRLFREAVRRFFGNRRILVVGGANMVSYAVSESCFQFSGAFIATLWPVWAIGISQVLSNLGAALSFRLSGRLIDRFRELPLLIASRLYGRVTHILATAMPSPASPVIMASSSLFFGVSTVSAENLLQKEFSDGERATMGSIGSMGGAVLMALYAPLLGLLADASGPGTAILCSQLLLLAPIAVLAREAARERKGR